MTTTRNPPCLSASAAMLKATTAVGATANVRTTILDYFTKRGAGLFWVVPVCRLTIHLSRHRIELSARKPLSQPNSTNRTCVSVTGTEKNINRVNYARSDGVVAAIIVAEVHEAVISSRTLIATHSPNKDEYTTIWCCVRLHKLRSGLWSTNTAHAALSKSTHAPAAADDDDNTSSSTIWTENTR